MPSLCWLCPRRVTVRCDPCKPSPARRPYEKFAIRSGLFPSFLELPASIPYCPCTFIPLLTNSTERPMSSQSHSQKAPFGVIGQTTSPIPLSDLPLRAFDDESVHPYVVPDARPPYVPMKTVCIHINQRMTTLNLKFRHDMIRIPATMEYRPSGLAHL